MENVMRKLRISKITLNIGAGKDQRLLEKGMKLLKSLTGITPVKTITYKRLQAWGLRPGLPVGCMITIRDQEKISALLPRLLEAKDRTLSLKMFDNNGNVSFGIPECIDISDYKYDPDIGIIGLQVSVTITRPGYRVMRRKLRPTKMDKNQWVGREESINFMKDNYKIAIKEEIEDV